MFVMAPGALMPINLNEPTSQLQCGATPAGSCKVPRSQKIIIIIIVVVVIVVIVI
jgi:hypothetical protein